MSYKKFIDDLNKGIIGDILVFSGAEDFLMNKALSLVINRYVDESSQNIDVKHLDGDKVSAYDILGEAKAYSMFSEKRVIIVHNFLPLYRKSSDIGLDELLDHAKGKLDSSIVIFILESRYVKDMTSLGKKFKKATGDYDFGRLQRPELIAFINKRVHNAGKIINDRTRDYLIDIIGYYNNESTYDLTLLDQDIEKLVRASEEDVISPTLLEEVLIGDSDKFVFNLIDAITASDRAKAFEVTEAIIRERDEAMQVLSLLTKQFEIMYDVLEMSREGLGFKDIAKLTGINEFRIKKAYSARRNYTQDRVKSLLIELYNYDRDIKKSSIDRNLALELFVLSATR